MTGRITAVYGNLVTAAADGRVVQNAIGQCVRRDNVRLLSEVIRVRGHSADLQVFEDTGGLKPGDAVEFQDQMLSVTLGPGLLGQIYDGLQNPLPELAAQSGFFLETGRHCPGLATDKTWSFTPAVAPGARVEAGDGLGTVPEGIFEHRIMVPFRWHGPHTVESVETAGVYALDHPIAVLKDASGRSRPVSMTQTWPVKIPLNVSRRRMLPTDPLVTRIRIIDAMFPVARGGTYCIPGPFGAGKTVLQQITAQHAEIDVVILAACGERAGEVVENLREFPKLTDPRTGRSLMERTIIICNTSAMPVAAREASVYTAATLAEYYRQMGLHVLLLADSTSRWAQAMRELSGRLEEIPGEEAFPAYLESRIAAFYERAGVIELRDGSVGSLTIGGTVSPAGGNFEEPVTQGTLKVVGAFHGLSRPRAEARMFPSIDPLESWSKYHGIIEPTRVRRMHELLRQGDEVRQMMTVVGEQRISMQEFLILLKAEFVDSCFLQQNAFDDVDSGTPADRQAFAFDKVSEVVERELDFPDHNLARAFFAQLSEFFRDWNFAASESEDYPRLLDEIDKMLSNPPKAT